jgi:RimJ/RimL family protein N-acetyltransferase
VPSPICRYRFTLPIVSTTEFAIAPMREADIPGFLSALDSVARERRYLALLEAPTLDDAREFVRTLRERGFPNFIATVDKRIVGWCDIAPLNRAVYRHVGVLGIGVVAEFRGCGIGSALLRTALARAREIGLTRIELTVRAANHVALTLYQKFGFAVEGTKRNAVKIDGAYDDLLMMALLYPERVG